MSDPMIPPGDHDGWLLSLANGERRAYLDVRLFLAAIGRLCNIMGYELSLTVEQVHKLFPIFGKEMNWPLGHLYEVQQDTGKCPAVSLYYRDDIPSKKKGLWLLFPWSEDVMKSWRFDDNPEPEREKALEAARIVCRELLPDWRW